MTNPTDELFGRTKLTTIQRDFRKLREGIRGGDWDATEAAWEKCERWLVMDVPAIASLHPLPSPTVGEAAMVILGNRWGGYGNSRAMNAMFDHVHEMHGRHMLPVSHYDGVLHAALTALAQTPQEGE